jgi:hypothetical protein
MKQISDSGGNPDVFHVNRRVDGRLGLGNYYAKPVDRWLDYDEFVFRVPRK